MNKEEAIAYLKRYVKTDLFYEQGHYNAIDTVLNYIEELENKLDKQKQLTKLAETITDESIKEALIEFEKDYIPKKKVQDKIEELENRNYNDYTREQDGNEVKYSILKEFEELLEEEK